VSNLILPSIVYGNGIGIVANVYYAPWQVTTDGFQTFTTLSLPDQISYLATSVQFVNEQFILFGLNGVIATSDDAATWKVDPFGLPCIGPTSLLTYNGQFVVAMSGYQPNIGPIFISSDGVEWDLFTSIPNLTNLYYQESIDSYVATTIDGMMYGDLGSEDWKEVMLPPDQDSFLAPITGNGIWIFTTNVRATNELDGIGTIMISSDLAGSSWDIALTDTFQTFSLIFTSPVYIDQTFYVGDIYQNQLLMSPNGSYWGYGQLPTECDQLNDIASAGDMFYVTCDSGEWYTWVNNEWTSVTGFGYVLFLDQLSNGEYVAVDGYNMIWKSADGISWTETSGPESDLFATDVEFMAYSTTGLTYGLLGRTCNFWNGDF